MGPHTSISSRRVTCNFAFLIRPYHHLLQKQSESRHLRLQISHYIFKNYLSFYLKKYRKWRVLTCFMLVSRLAYYSYPEYGGDMFFRNVSWFSMYYKTLYSTKIELFITTGVRTSNSAISKIPLNRCWLWRHLQVCFMTRTNVYYSRSFLLYKSDKLQFELQVN
jgi:hypothetical protein